jgi:hypothetical protein
MKDKLAIIVPYRDREKHLNVFIPHMHEFLKDKEIDYDIFIAEQADDRPFNYGKLCNVVVNEISKDYTYFAFHDIDMLPITDECDYSYPDEPVHLAVNVEAHDNKLPYPQYFGGVILINREDFEEVNGYSNEYWGYGFEDLDLLKRIERSGLYLEKYYDENRVYTNYNELDILPYRIENVKLTNKDNTETISYNQFGSEDFLSGRITPITKKTTNDSYSVVFWFNDNIQRNERINLVCFEGYDTGVFLTKGNEIVFQVWDNEKNHIEIITSYSRNRWNHVVFSYDKSKNSIRLSVNKETIEKELPKDFTPLDYSQNNLRISDSETPINISNVLIFSEYISQEVIETHYDKNDSALDIIQTEYGIAPVSLFDYNRIYRQKIILDSGINHNHLTINGSLNSNQVQNHHDEIFIPLRIEGDYKSLKHDDDNNIIKKYYRNDPDVDENSDIFFHEMLTGEIDYTKIGLNSLKYDLMDTKDMKTYKLMRIVT